MELFYAPSLHGETFCLSPEESKHVVRVMRKKIGDTFFVTNGKGSLFEVRILSDHPKKCRLQVLSEQKEYQKRAARLHIAIAPTKNINRFEWFLEKSTEIGIDHIIPLLCEHSERKIIKPERLRKVIIAAAKQSLKAYFPELGEMTPFSQIIRQEFRGKKYIALCRDEALTPLSKYHNSGEDALILIGPEGGFSPKEIGEAKEHGFLPVSLGNSRLRTETAGIVACTLLNQ